MLVPGMYWRVWCPVHTQIRRVSVFFSSTAVSSTGTYEHVICVNAILFWPYLVTIDELGNNTDVDIFLVSW